MRDDFGSARRAADIEAYGKSLDDLRARYNPLFAVQREYKTEIKRIADAERVGALATAEAATAMEDASRVYARQVSAIQAVRSAYDQMEAAARSASQRAVNTTLGVRDDFGSDARAADIEAYGRSLDDLRAKYNPLYAAQRQYLAQLKEIRDAQRQGALSAQEATAAIQEAKAAFAGRVTQTRAQQNPNGSVWSRLRPDQKVNLGYQANDVFTTVAMGMNPMMIAAQQGPQIVQAMGGVRPTLSAIGQLLTPVSLGLGAVTAALGVGATAWYGYTRATKEAAAAASSFGRNSGVTAADIERSAYSAAAPAGLSVSQAREVATELTRTGKIGADQFAGIMSVAKDLATTLGTDVNGAAVELGRLFADPAAGADQLASMGLLDAATARLTKSLSEQGDTGRATETMLEGLRQRLASTAEATTWLGRTWDSVHRRFSDSTGGLGRWLSGDALPLEQQLAYARTELEGTERAKGSSADSSAMVARLRQQVTELEKRVAEQASQSSERQAQARLAQTGSAAVAVAQRSPVNAQLQEELALRTEIQRLQEGLTAPGLSAREQDQITRAIEGTQHALDGLSGARERQAEISRLDLQIQQERDPVERANLAATREYLSLQGQQLTLTEEATRVERAREKSLEESAAAATNAARTISRGLEDQIAAARLELSLVGATNTERMRALALLQAQQQIRDAGITPGSPEALRQEMLALENADLQSRIAAGQSAVSTLRSGRDQAEMLQAEISLLGKSNGERARTIALLQAEQQIRSQEINPASAQAQQIRDDAARNADLSTRLQAAQAVRQQWEGGRDQIEQLELEARLIGATSVARTHAIALLQTEQQIRRAGIDAGSAEAQMLREQTARIVEQTAALERRQDAWSTYAGAGEGALDAIGDALAEHKTSWKDWGDVVDDVVTDINKSLLKLTLVNPLKNALLGTNAGTLQDLGGGASGGGLIGQLMRGVGLGPAASSVPAGAVVASSAIASGALGTALNPMWVQIVGTATGMLGNLLGGDGKAASGLTASFDSALQRMMTDAKAAGHDITITSGLRSFAQQQKLWDDALAKYGSADLARKWVAPPGSSQHNLGNAADLGYGSSAARSWAQSNASNYGLNFPLSNESWHVEPVGARSGALAAVNPSRELSSALGTATRSVNQFGTGMSDVARTATSATGDLSVSTGQLASASESAATSATSFTGGLEGAFGQILGGLGQIGTGFLNGFGSILESLLGGLGSGGGGSLISGIAGMFGFADGGIMTSAGPIPLRAYSAGGIASSPQFALYGEGDQNEAFVPLPDGRRIPVALSLSSKMAGGGDASAFAAAAALKQASATPNLSVNIQTLPGTTAEVGEPQPDGNGGFSLDVLMRRQDGRTVEDIRKGGPISRALERQYGLNRTRGNG
ncbi:phage tail length tape measure family protein [Castellaniella sp.]|uniref:phage tail length tape measure family protein n=1 Tax=Castellaniella sp. TaxID=1955812 RepID=UPI002AFDD456|nr:phage tail length tape measure family protein [Castellaniella sp.]